MSRDSRQKLNEVHYANGYEKALEGYCPASMIELEVDRAKNNFIKIACENLPSQFRLNYQDLKETNNSIELINEFIQIHLDYYGEKV